MQTSKQTLGILGEELAAHELKRLGYKILLRNYECLLGEIDLIAKERGYLVFVEVKTRSSDAQGSPEEALTPHKRQQIIRVARFYMKRYGIHETPCRFDVVSIMIPADREPQIRVIPSAFREDGC